MANDWTTTVENESTALPNFEQTYRTMLAIDISYLRTKAAWLGLHCLPEAAWYEAAAKALEGTP